MTALALPGITVTAPLFVRALQRVFTRPTPGHAVGFADLLVPETVSRSALFVLNVAIGWVPRPSLDLIEPAAGALVLFVGRFTMRRPIGAAARLPRLHTPARYTTSTYPEFARGVASTRLMRSVWQ